MFLIEAEGKRILHTGDFRGHGYLSKGLLPTIQRYIGRGDLLIIEGTMLSRKDETILTEAALSQKTAELMKQHKYVFVHCHQLTWSVWQVSRMPLEACPPNVLCWRIITKRTLWTSSPQRQGKRNLQREEYLPVLSSVGTSQRCNRHWRPFFVNSLIFNFKSLQS